MWGRWTSRHPPRSEDAQRHFLRGVAILHSFGWKQAIEQFQAAQEIEPDFALAYWGETLCYNHPLFGAGRGLDEEHPRGVLQRPRADPLRARREGGDGPGARLSGGGRGALGRGRDVQRTPCSLYGSDGAALRPLSRRS